VPLAEAVLEASPEDSYMLWAAVALFTFVAGFSEPFFLGLVRRVGVVPDKDV
jgi:hypothetical protein